MRKQNSIQNSESRQPSSAKSGSATSPDACGHSRDKEEFLESLIKCSPGIIIAVDQDLRIIEFNGSAQSALGYSKKEVLGTKPGILFTSQEDGLTVFEEAVREGASQGSISARRKAGEDFILKGTSKNIVFDVATEKPSNASNISLDFKQIGLKFPLFLAVQEGDCSLGGPFLLVQHSAGIHRPS